MTVSEAFITALIVALFAAVVAGLLALFQYLITKKIESDGWEREQRAQEIDRIDSAAAEVTRHAGLLMTETYYGEMGRELILAQADLRASYARWDMLLNPHCTEEERKKIKKELEFLYYNSDTRSIKVTETVIEITHTAKERLIKGADRSWWKIWDR